jgi:DNA-binding GntR family transcriptional regulator
MAYQAAEPPPLSPLADPVSRTDLIVQRIREAILTGQLRPGEPLVERELAAQLGVSKTPIREALKILSQRGLVDSLSFRGAAVRTVDPDLAGTVYDARLVVEPEALRRAVPLHSPASLAEARSLLAEGSRLGEGQDFLALSLANRSFHHVLHANCGNALLTSFLDQLQDQVSLISIACWRRNATWPREADEHEAILEAVEHGEAELAARRLADHIDGSKARVIGVLGAS